MKRRRTLEQKIVNNLERKFKEGNEELIDAYYKSSASRVFVVTLIISGFVFLCQFIEITTIMNMESHTSVKMQETRFENDHDDFSKKLKINLVLGILASILGVATAFKVRKTPEWRQPVAYINCIILLFSVGLFHTKQTPAVIAIMIASHIMYMGIIVLCTVRMCQVVLICLSSLAYDFLYSYIHIVSPSEEEEDDGEGTFFIVFFLIYGALSCLAGYHSIQASHRQFFVEKAQAEQNEEFFDIFNHFEDGTMIVQVTRKEQVEAQDVEYYEQNDCFDAYLGFLKHSHSIEINFFNQCIEKCVLQDKNCNNVEELIAERVFKVYNFDQIQDDGLKKQLQRRNSLECRAATSLGNNLLSIQELILLNHQTNRKLYFEIAHEPTNSSSTDSRSLSNDEKEAPREILEVSFSGVKFAQADCCLIKFRDINHIVSSEQSKARVLFQEALTATVSHEQMTPLNSIINLTDLLITNTVDSLGVDHRLPSCITELKSTLGSLRAVHSSASMMKLLNQSLLDSQAIQDHNFSPRIVEMNVQDMIEEILTYFDIQLKTMDITVRLSNDKEYPVPESLYCDPDRFQEILYHLIANSVKFNKLKAGKINIRTSLKKGRGVGKKQLHVEIADTGKGMTREQIRRAYQAFSSVKEKAEDKENGLVLSTSGIGLGISTTNKIVEALGGKLTIKSNTGESPGSARSLVLEDNESYNSNFDDPEFNTGTTVSFFVKCYEIGDCRSMNPSKINPFEEDRHSSEKKKRIPRKKITNYFTIGFDIKKAQIQQEIDLQEIKQSRFKISHRRERKGSIAPTKDTLIQLSKLAKKSLSVATDEDKSAAPHLEEMRSQAAAPTIEGCNLESDADCEIPNFSQEKILKDQHNTTMEALMNVRSPHQPREFVTMQTVKARNPEKPEADFIIPDVPDFPDLDETFAVRYSNQNSAQTTRRCQCQAPILCVDDNPMNLMPLNLLLSNKCGLKVDEALNGAEAVDRFVSDRSKQCGCHLNYRLIIMDINMPEMDGVTASKIIFEKQQEFEQKMDKYNKQLQQKGMEPMRIPPINIVALTSYTNKSTIEECLKVGMKEVLHKPIKLCDLQSVLRRFYYQ